MVDKDSISIRTVSFSFNLFVIASKTIGEAGTNPIIGKSIISMKNHRKSREILSQERAALLI